MPFKSEKQKKWMYANKPELAAKWEDEAEVDKKNTLKVPKMPKSGKKVAKAVRKALKTKTKKAFGRKM